jgi:hypothetical protein
VKVVRHLLPREPIHLLDQSPHLGVAYVLPHPGEFLERDDCVGRTVVSESAPDRIVKA